MIFWSSCKKEVAEQNEVEKNINKRQDVMSGKEVKVIVSSDDKKALEYFNILSYDSFNGGKPTLFYSEKLSSDSLLIRINSIQIPQIIEFQTFGQNFYRSRMFVTPGDNISININEGSLTFSGDSPSHFKFFYELDSSDGQWGKIKYKGDIKDYKRKADSVYNKNIVFFESFISNNQVSQEFIRMVSSELEFEYLYNLIAPRLVESKNGDVVFNDLDGPSKFITENSEANPEMVFNYNDYFGKKSIEKYKDKNFVSNDYFKRSMVLYIRHYFTNHSYLNYSHKNYQDELEYIENHLTGRTKNYAHIRLIKDYYEKGFGQDLINSKILQQDIDDLKMDVEDQSYMDELDNLSSQLRVQNSEIPNEILKERLLTPKGDTVTFKDVLTRNDDLKMFQFWAYKDRCKICAEGIVKLNDLIEKGEIGPNVVHISINRKFNNWVREVEFFNDYMKVADNYMIIEDNMTSDLLGYFKIRTDQTIELPRYLIINNRKEVLLNTIPLPTDSIVFKETIQSLQQ